jgi:Fur family peroxide stress response transcriptional regulator
MAEDHEQTIATRVNRFKEICRQARIRLTPQRLELFREIAGAKDHPAAEDVYKRLRSRMPTISLDTVYRTLATFERHGVITRLQIPGERGRFDSNPLPHHHLVCVRCKSVQDFYWPIFEKMELPPDTKRWGRVGSRHAELRGVCNECLKKKRPKSG